MAHQKRTSLPIPRTMRPRWLWSLLTHMSALRELLATDPPSRDASKPICRFWSVIAALPIRRTSRSRSRRIGDTLLKRSRMNDYLCAPAAPPPPKRKTFASLYPNRLEKPGFRLARLMQLSNRS
jgi:hypothetical protein